MAMFVVPDIILQLLMINSRFWLALIHVAGETLTLQDDRAILGRHLIWEIISGITILISHGFRKEFNTCRGHGNMHIFCAL